jgi:DnaJ-class molecular chaperone
VISSVPDRSKVKLSKKQKQANTKFKAAVIYAQSILRDPEKRKAYAKKLKRGRSVYHAALAEYLRKASTKTSFSKQ